VETKAHLCFLKKGRGRCGCVYGTKRAVDRKSLGTTDIRFWISMLAAGDSVTLHKVALSDMITENVVALENGKLYIYSLLVEGVLIRKQVRCVQHECIPVQSTAPDTKQTFRDSALRLQMDFQNTSPLLTGLVHVISTRQDIWPADSAVRPLYSHTGS
jgi:hypothetical protein